MLLRWSSPFGLAWPLQWRHNGRDSVSNHQTHDCLLKGLFRHRSKKTWRLRVTGLCAGNSPHKWPVTRKMFPFDDVIMLQRYVRHIAQRHSGRGDFDYSYGLEKCGSLKSMSFKFIQSSRLDICCEIALRWMPRNLTNARSVLDQVIDSLPNA